MKKFFHDLTPKQKEWVERFYIVFIATMTLYGWYQCEVTRKVNIWILLGLIQIFGYLLWDLTRSFDAWIRKLPRIKFKEKKPRYTMYRIRKGKKVP